MFRHNMERTAHAPPSFTNHSPVLAPIADRTVSEGSTLTFTNTASDPDMPGQQIRFSLGLGAPAGATLDPTNGVFQWAPTSADLLTTQSITVVVSDNETPPLSDVQCFQVTVQEGLRLESIAVEGSQVTLSWSALPGAIYRVQYKTDLVASAWLSLPGDVTATSDTATKSDVLPSGLGQRFYRVEKLP